MRIFVTGVAGFIGSQLAEALLDEGHDVVGVDAFTPYYDRDAKDANLADLRDRPGFRFIEADLRDTDLDALLDGVDVVYHQAAQPGVRLSWSDGFATYDSCNVLATQRLLEATRQAAVDRFVYASSSSVYGNADSYPVIETDLPRPHSPYGVTKLAAEHLCGVYAANCGLSTVALRYFTVYGPRQRPDMAFHRLIEGALDQQAFPLYGDGSHIRDFTYVGDVVRANVLAGTADVAPGTVVNVCAGGSTVLRNVIDAVANAVGSPVPIEQHAEQPGDVQRTGGSNDAAQRLLGWKPQTNLADGIAAQVAWHRSRRPSN
ncbi:GDP-mannose 4,6-dehydratase [Acidimicrobiia bacterium EGI L10123]|uniref:NAD-dependent epimerase/dehydratase family protein n=1 Tax=Salinilacustrithrix flava TaxID=2957203 RepID=UPI003D7C25F1|nr:GDP-mannose 4,6-dehydratase [Acidimicrobiia bacterium EGI L10123]